MGIRAPVIFILRSAALHAVPQTALLVGNRRMKIAQRHLHSLDCRFLLKSHPEYVEFGGRKLESVRDFSTLRRA